MMIAALIAGTMVLAGPGQPEEAAAPPASPNVRLIEAGEEPRRALRYSANKGDEFITEFIQTMTMAGGNEEGMQPGMPLPPVRQRMRLTITEADDASTRFEAKWEEADVEDDPEVMPIVIEAMRDALKSLEGMNSWFRVDRRGQMLDGDLEIPEGADPMIAGVLGEMKQSFAQMSTPFPEEPVGAGAVWEVDTKLDMMGLVMVQTATYRLLSIEGDVVKLATEVEGTMVPGKLNAGNMPGGGPPGDMELVEGGTKGRGSMTLSLRELMPRVAEVTAETRQTFKIEMFDEIETMRQQMTMELKITTKPAAQ